MSSEMVNSLPAFPSAASNLRLPATPEIARIRAYAPTIRISQRSRLCVVSMKEYMNPLGECRAEDRLWPGCRGAQAAESGLNRGTRVALPYPVRPFGPYLTRSFNHPLRQPAGAE